MKMYLHGVSTVVGRREPISAIEPLAADRALLTNMQALGLWYYRYSDETPLELAAQAVGETVRNAPVDVSEIEVLLYASSSPETGLLGGGAFLGFIERFGLTRATPIGVSLAECANFGSALRIARGLLAAQETSAVLIVTTDTCTEPRQRVLRDPLSVLSDGAASCLVTSGVPSRIEVLGTDQRTDQVIRMADPAAAAEHIRMELSVLVEEMLARASLSRHDVRCVIANNVNQEAVRFMATASGFDHRICYLDNIGDLAHVSSADNLINLQTYLEDGVAPGEIVVMISHGAGTRGVTLLRIH